MKRNLLLLLKRFSLLGIFFLFAMNALAYTPPTALQVPWGGTDQTSTCHQYGDYITNVTFAGINNTTTGSGAKAWHSDYGRTTPQVAPGEVTMGQSYTISVTVTGQTFLYQYLAVYIDWNQNNINGTSSYPWVLNTNENPVVWSNYTGSGTKTLTGTITVPTGINPGQVYMRVMLDGDSGGSDGGNYVCAIGCGEFQDYVLNVTSDNPLPTITGISPTSGPTAGGTSVVITGTNLTGATAVKFGSTNATSYTVNSATQITAVSPAGSAGAVDATVTTTYGTSAISGSDQFTYVAAPTVTGSAASSITTTTATLNGTVNAQNASTAVTFDYGLTTSYGTSVTATQSPVTGTTATAVTIALSGLVPNTTYHYRVNGVNTAGITNGTDLTFTTTAAAPTATTSAATSISTTGVTLNGSVNANNASTVVTFEYGLTTAYGTSVAATQSPVTGTSATAVSYVLSGLVPNTTYHFRIKGVNTAGTTNGTDLTFTTTAAVPTATTLAATGITTTEVTLNGSVNANNASTVVTFEYGLTTAYGTTVTATQSPVTGTTANAVSYVLTGLVPNTTYHFRVKGVNTAGTTNGTDLTFTTTAAVPTATTSAATSITTTGATLNGSVNANNASTVVTFEYGLTTAYGTTVTATQSPVTGTTANAVSYVLTGLVPNTTYHFRVKGVNTAGTTNGTDLPFTTAAAAPTATTSAATSITTTGATLNGSVNANNASTVVTFEYGLTTAYGTSVTATQSPVIGTTATPVTILISGLVPNTTYHYRVNGVNTGGTTNGTDLTFTTAAALATATTLAATVVTSTGATLNGGINPKNATTVVTFDYGLTTSYGASVTATQSPVTGTTTSAVSYVVTGLEPNTTYHFRVNGVNTAGTTNGSDLTFTTTAALATATTSAASSITNTEATLNGSVNAKNASTVITFEYGLTTAYGTTVTATQSPVTGTTTTAVSYAISGLTSNTTYHFRVNGVNTAGTTNGTDLTFTTTAAVPAVIVISPTNGPTTGGTTVIITGTNLSTASALKFGSTNATGFTVNSATQITATAPAGSTGSVDITVTTAEGTSATSANDQFTYVAAPTVTTTTATTVTSTGATLNGTVNANNATSIVTFEYGLTNSYGTNLTADQSPVTGTGATSVNAPLAGLTPNTTYYFRVKAVNVGGTTYGNDATFTTPATVPDAPTIGNATDGNAQVTVSFTAPTFNGGSAITGYTVTSNPGNFTGTGTTSPITVTGLSNGTAYTFTITATNGTGTSTASAASNSVTPMLTTQVITFNAPTAKTYGDAAYNLTATSSSGLAVSYLSDNPAVATVSGTTLNIVGAGTANITALQAGNATYTAATNVIRQLTVNKKALSVTATADTKTYDGTTVSTAIPTVGTLATGDAINTVPTQVFDNAAVGTTHVLTASGLTIKNGSTDVTSNYDISYTSAIGTINKLGVTVTAVADTRTYDGTTVSSAIPTVGTFATGDAINVAPAQAFDNGSVGTTHVLTASGLTIKNGSTDVTGNYDISYATANGSITAKPLTITTPTVTLSKVYDGNNVATSTAGTLLGAVASDASNVTVTALASYDNANIGTNKTITVVYTLGGSAAGNYVAPANFVITGAQISSGTITLGTVSDPTPNSANTGLVLSYAVSSGAPTQYKLTFEATGIAAGLQNVSYTNLATTDISGSITIPVPNTTRPGKYKGTLQMRNDSGVESATYNFTMTVNIPTEYIVVKYNHVLVLDNSTKIFSTYQWYKDGKAIEGATKQFYRDPKGLVGTYSMQATSTNGEVLYSYPKVLNIPLTQKVIAYPSQVRANQTCTVEITDEAMELDLKGAELSVYSTQGIRVYYSNKVEKVNTIKLPIMDGVYSGRLTTADGQSFLFKVIVAN